MKELSIEEKVHRYDEAFERAKEWSETKNGYYTPKELCEEIFPELKESEDERIRKDIIHLVQKSHEQGGYALHKYEAGEMLAWLEKQGQTFTKKDVDDAYLKGISDTKNELEKQGEQKPAWSEEDEKIALSIEQIMNCASLLNMVPEKVDKIRTWLKSIKDKVQPKQEWSEEEEENFKKAIKVLKVSNFHHTADMLQEMKYKLIPLE